MVKKNEKATGDFSLKRAFSLIRGLTDQLKALRRDVRALKDLFNVKDNWYAVIREWIGSPVRVRDATGEMESGELKWTDRYTLGVVTPENKERLYNKGGIVYIERANREK
jgi:hypothetical protein